MIANWILAFLGLAIYFLMRYNYRKNRANFNPIFWIKDNWTEFLLSVLATLALMMIFTDPETSIDIHQVVEKIPFITSLPVIKVLSLLAGFGNTYLFYNLVKVAKKKRR